MAQIKQCRVAYLIHTFPLLSQTFLVDEIVAMRAIGVSLDIYGVRRPRASEYPESYKGCCDETMYALPVILWRHLFSHLRWFAQYPLRYLDCWRFVLTAAGCSWRQRIKLLAYLCEAVALSTRITPERYDHLHVHFLFGGALVALFLNKLTGIRYSATAHGCDFLVDHWLLVEKVHHAAFVRVGTRYNAKYIQKLIHSSDEAKLFVLPFGIDHRRLIGDKLAIVEQVAQRKNDPIRIINVGRLVWQKGQMALIEAAHILSSRGRDFRLEIIGEGELHQEIDALITRYKLQERVVLCGALPREEVLVAMRSADIFAFSSVSEGFGIVLLEAMMCGLAVVAADITGVAEIVTDGQTGTLYCTQTPSALADSLEQLICDEALRRRYQLSALDDALMRFDHKDKISQLYTRMASC